jgi:hypothetical protein
MPMEAVAREYLYWFVREQTIGKFQEGIIAGTYCGSTPTDFFNFSCMVTKLDAVPYLERLLDMK